MCGQTDRGTTKRAGQEGDVTEFTTIEYALEDGIARLTLNRPEKLNSFNVAMHTEVQQALDLLEADQTARVLVLTGAGRGFCAGQDLDDRAVKPDSPAVDLGESIEKYYNPLIRRLTALKLPVICAVNGVAAGAGANIALACDIVIASKAAKFVQAFCKLGLVPDSGGTWSLPRAVGQARALGLALLGAPIDAETAERWGMIWKAVEPEAFEQEVEALARHFAVQPTKGLAFIKQAIRAAATNTFDQQLDLERDLQREAGRSADYREGVAAFLEKRTPSFTGA